MFDESTTQPDHRDDGQFAYQTFGKVDPNQGVQINPWSIWEHPAIQNIPFELKTK